jgi:hypothetical protein
MMCDAADLAEAGEIMNPSVFGTPFSRVWATQEMDLFCTVKSSIS